MMLVMVILYLTNKLNCGDDVDGANDDVVMLIVILNSI